MATVEDQPETARAGRLQDKVAVITGASSGIGRATMELFGREGARVVGTARREAELQEGLDKVKARGGDGIVVPADLEDVRRPTTSPRPRWTSTAASTCS